MREQLEKIILEHNNALLDAKNGKTNPTLGELVDKPVQAILSALQADILGMIGENEPEFNTPHPDLPAMSRNRLREQLRKAITDYFEVTG